jgi:nitric oxide reductase subunit B
MAPAAEWREGWLRWSFWSMNVGLFCMCVLSLLPVGLLQTWASVDQGYWYARSTEFLGSPLLQQLRWMRAPGDILFALGEAIFVLFIFSIRLAPRAATTDLSDFGAPAVVRIQTASGD